MVKKVCTAVLMTRREADRQILGPNDSQRDENFSFVSFSFPHPVRHRLDHAVDGVGKLLPLLRPPAVLLQQQRQGKRPTQEQISY
jgi:hypothetical protein